MGWEGVPSVNPASGAVPWERRQSEPGHAQVGDGARQSAQPLRLALKQPQHMPSSVLVVFEQPGYLLQGSVVTKRPALLERASSVPPVREVTDCWRIESQNLWWISFVFRVWPVGIIGVRMIRA